MRTYGEWGRRPALRIGWLVAVTAAVSACGSGGSHRDAPAPWVAGTGAAPHGTAPAQPQWPFVVDPPVPAPPLATSPQVARAAVPHALRAVATRRPPASHPVSPHPEAAGDPAERATPAPAPQDDGTGQQPPPADASPAASADQVGEHDRDPRPTCSGRLNR